MRQLLYVLAFFFANSMALSAWAHGGEDHEHAATPMPTTTMLPRVSAASEEFELLAVLDAKNLLLTLDRFASNEPVADARIEVESGKSTWLAVQTAPGVYAIPAKHFAGHGKFPLIISVQAGKSTDLLAMTLDLSQPAAESWENPLVQPGHRWNDRLLWTGAAIMVAVLLLVLVAIGFVGRKIIRHRRHRRSKQQGKD